MLLLRLWNYVRGYVIIIVEGYFLEKFINICTRRQILLWDLKKQSKSRISLKISIKGFKKLRDIARKTHCRVRIQAKCGLPFVVHKYKKRKAFVLGAFIFIAIFYVLTSFVWNVEINGNNKLETQAIMDYLADYGIKPGVLKYGINTDEVVNKIMMDMEELAWVEISLKGTKVRVEVRERVKPPETLPKDQPCDIVAARDGLIKSVFTKVGQQQVKAGDTVTRGQVLISGTVVSRNENVPPKKVHAMGIVNARTWYEKKVAVETVTEEKVRTGRKADIYSLELFNKRLSLQSKQVPFQNYEKVEIKKELSIGEDLVLPFAIIIETFYENNIIKKEIDLDEAKSIAAEKARQELAEEIPESAQIVKTDLKFTEDENGKLTAVVLIECLEDIGVEKAIGGN
ncbi:sporulation protein YqfD [Clostridium thermosuccinogenes]|jgi:similar to stage IV sporulation protein|uniref:Sporulation protein YqfD n=1 Tax=Clostridium thermosuccinogenes TaxID=84032 RepID=A0A2K2F2D5_9CLOT|nr:sporulation protein YqfD [Pseudoclostridium thermosuccinogenes]AUS96386.1 sporulation protein YqfD [Pseudoclostridium thermosuccinogenes]PNT92948.1 sporulation protein YqfD [Pseudoclostridium thermosuccinogenes]PNT95664.1 sporulation protein YqfD [Pseudoclostridium thermosuccinogenes]PNT96887.1 sporulation protein YqfD [Pseudoclostridium thermosuccinogenes]